MIEVIISWIYIIILAFISGFAFISLMSKDSCTVYKSRRRTDYGTDDDVLKASAESGALNISPVAYLYSGIGLFTVYAQLFSIFYKVSLLANLILIIANVILTVLFKTELYEELKAIKSRINAKKLAVYIILFLLFALGTSAGYMHYDSDLYHAQSIRWIEKYGVVPGLGNLHTRLAYNSAAFPLTALFSGSFLLDRSLHTVAGLMAYLLAILCLPLFGWDVLKKPKISDFARIAAIYYLCSVFDEMTAPASDYFLVLTVFAIVIMLLDVSERGERNYTPYALLSLLALIALGFKLSGALVVLIAIIPAYMLIRDKNIKAIVKYILLGLLTAAPLIIRNVILSGYLFYPITGINIFDFDFKIPEDIAEYDSREIRVYGRGYTDVSKFDESIRTWLPDWIRRLGTVDKAAFICAAICVIIFIVYAICCIYRKRKNNYIALCTTGVIGICFVFWLLNAPLIRYGCVFLYLFPMLTAGLLVSEIMDFGKYKSIIWSAALVLFFIYKAVFFAKDIYGISAHYKGHLVRQQDYGDYAEIISEYEIDGVKIYYPTEGDRVGYTPFPSSPMIQKNINFRTGDIKDGFKNGEE